MVRLVPDYPVCRYRLGAQLAALGHLDEALQCMEAALVCKPNWAPALQAIAKLKANRSQSVGRKVKAP